jgi:hypothetical protein
MTREEMAAAAQAFADLAVLQIAAGALGARVVVIVTDEEGEYVGVGSTTNPEDTAAIILCAHFAEDRVDHPAPASAPLRELHACGGEILEMTSANVRTCDICSAFRFVADGPGLPSGTSKVANLDAWEAGRRQSPDK